MQRVVRKYLIQCHTSYRANKGQMGTPNIVWSQCKSILSLQYILILFNLWGFLLLNFAHFNDFNIFLLLNALL